MIALTSSRSKLPSPLFDGVSGALNLLIRPAPLVDASLLTASVCSDSLRRRAFNEFEELMASLFWFSFLTATISHCCASYLTSTLPVLVPVFSPDLAGYYAVITEHQI